MSSPADGAALLDTLLGSVPVDALLLPTAVMVVAVVGIDVVFAVVDRMRATRNRLI
ncbi:MAG: hypothetical protein ABEH77_03565 [Halobacteriaceae archaeon]